MRQTFDNKMPVAEQLVRSNAMRKVGRKHGHIAHSWGPGSHKQQLHKQNVADMKTRKARKFKDKVAAYWRGDLEEYPAS